MALSRINANSIQDGTVVASDIADGSITTAKIADANVTAGKIVSVANTQITGNITSSQIIPDPVFNGNTTVTNIITGAGTVGAPSIAPTGDTNTGIYFPAADNIGFAIGGTIRGRWTTDGLCFGSDTAAANALDDYEEGNWTPVSATAGYTFSSSSGKYTKIGRIVYITVSVTISAVPASNSALIIGGLPINISVFGTGSVRESTTTGAIYMLVTNGTANLELNSMDGISAGSQRTIRTEQYLGSLFYIAS